MGLHGLLGASFATLLAGAPQVTITTPTPYIPGQTGRQGDKDYGAPRVADLDGLNLAPESYQKAHVITIGQLDLLRAGQYWTLRDGSASVLLLAGFGVTSSDLDALLRTRVELRGIVRRLKSMTRRCPCCPSRGWTGRGCRSRSSRRPIVATGARTRPRRLDPTYKGDTVRWLEVAGKAEVAGGIVYLRASKVVLAAKPNEIDAAVQ